MENLTIETLIAELNKFVDKSLPVYTFASDDALNPIVNSDISYVEGYVYRSL